MVDAKKRWIGDKPICQHCGCSPKTWFVDGHEEGDPEVWSVFCEGCWERKGAGRFAVGFGQKYDAITLELLEGDQRTAEDEAFAAALGDLAAASMKNRPN